MDLAKDESPSVALRHTGGTSWPSSANSGSPSGSASGSGDSSALGLLSGDLSASQCEALAKPASRSGVTCGIDEVELASTDTDVWGLGLCVGWRASGPVDQAPNTSRVPTTASRAACSASRANRSAAAATDTVGGAPGPLGGRPLRSTEKAEPAGVCTVGGPVGLWWSAGCGEAAVDAPAALDGPAVVPGVVVFDLLGAAAPDAGADDGLERGAAGAASAAEPCSARLADSWAAVVAEAVDAYDCWQGAVPPMTDQKASAPRESGEEPPGAPPPPARPEPTPLTPSCGPDCCA